MNVCDGNCRFETENKQLHQIIAQLRSVRRVTKEDVDVVLAERDDCKLKIVAMQDQVDRCTAMHCTALHCLECTYVR